MKGFQFFIFRHRTMIEKDIKKLKKKLLFINNIYFKELKKIFYILEYCSLFKKINKFFVKCLFQFVEILSPIEIQNVFNKNK